VAKNGEVSIMEYKKLVEIVLPNEFGHPGTKINRRDLIFYVNMLGNDYLPKGKKGEGHPLILLRKADVATDTVIRAKVIIRMMHQILQLYPLRKHQLQKWIPNLLLCPRYVCLVMLMVNTTKIRMTKMKLCIIIIRPRNILSRRNMMKHMIWILMMRVVLKRYLFNLCSDIRLENKVRAFVFGLDVRLSL